MARQAAISHQHWSALYMAAEYQIQMCTCEVDEASTLLLQASLGTAVSRVSNHEDLKYHKKKTSPEWVSHVHWLPTEVVYVVWKARVPEPCWIWTPALLQNLGQITETCVSSLVCKIRMTVAPVSLARLKTCEDYRFYYKLTHWAQFRVYSKCLINVSYYHSCGKSELAS